MSSIRKRLVRSSVDNLKLLDVFPKAEQSVLRTTVSGKRATWFFVLFAFILFLSEVKDYFNTFQVHQIMLDKTDHRLMMLNLDLTVAMPCDSSLLPNLEFDISVFDDSGARLQAKDQLKTATVQFNFYF